jgi:predicted nucleic acid-binding protein
MISMNNKILCDADFIIALFVDHDSNYIKATKLYNATDNSLFIVTNITIYEVATVLSRKLSQSEAVYTLESIRQRFINPIIFNHLWEAEVYDLYNSFDKKNISFFDCACMILAKKLDCKIASFDSFYPAEILA